MTEMVEIVLALVKVSFCLNICIL